MLGPLGFRFRRRRVLRRRVIGGRAWWRAREAA